MAELNSDTVVDDDKPVTEDDLRALKYPEEEVETTEVEDETSEGEETEEESEETSEEDGQTDDQTTEEEIPTFVKQFDYIKGDTPEEYAKNLEQAYENSSTEGRRINAELQELKKAPPTTSVTATTEEADEPVVKTPMELYMEQKLEQETQQAFSVIRKEYPQVNNPDEYAKFTQEVTIFAQAGIAKGRLAPPEELYNKAAISLGWEKTATEPDDKEKLGQALKDGTASPKAGSAPSKPKSAGPKVSEAQLKLNRKMYPGKTDQEIIDELTPYL